MISSMVSFNYMNIILILLGFLGTCIAQDEGYVHPYNSSDPLVHCSLAPTWKATFENVNLITPCECKPGGPEWDPSIMDKTPAFVEAATTEMCQNLQSAKLEDDKYSLSTSALYQRPGNSSNSSCVEHPENCQNALATITFNRGLGSPPCPPAYRVFTADECVVGLRAAVVGCDDRQTIKSWVGAGGTAQYDCFVFSLDLAPIANKENADLFNKMINELKANQTAHVNTNYTVPIANINSTISFVNGTLSNNATCNVTVPTNSTSGLQRKRYSAARFRKPKAPGLPYRW